MTAIQALALLVGLVAWLVLCQFVIYITEHAIGRSIARGYHRTRKALDAADRYIEPTRRFGVDD